MKKKLLLHLRGLLLGSRLLRGLLLSSHVGAPPYSVIRTRGSIGLGSGSLGETRSTSCPARTSSATPRVSPSRLISDETRATLAVVRNGSLTRVGSVASVVATTRSIAIQTVLIHRVHFIR